MTQKTRTQLKNLIGENDPFDFFTDLLDSFYGIDEVASQLEAEAGIANDRLMTPLRVAQAIAALGGVVTIVEYTDDHVLVAGDAGKVVELLNASAITLTIPADASVDFPVGTLIGARQTGAGTVTLAGAGGVTVNSKDGALSLAGQWVTVTLEKRSGNTWLVTGALT